MGPHKSAPPPRFARGSGSSSRASKRPQMRRTRRTVDAGSPAPDTHARARVTHSECHGPQWRPCLPERFQSSDSIRSHWIKYPPPSPEGRKRAGRGHGGGKSMGACGDGLPCIMAADFHPTSSSGVQVDGNRSSQSEDAGAGHRYFCAAPQRSMLPIPATPRGPDSQTPARGGGSGRRQR